MRLRASWSRRSPVEQRRSLLQLVVSIARAAASPSAQAAPARSRSNCAAGWSISSAGRHRTRMDGCNASVDPNFASFGNCHWQNSRYKAAAADEPIPVFSAKTCQDDGASPSGKAPAFDAGIRRFDPCRPSHLFSFKPIHTALSFVNGCN
jgi:hypothetical protein